MADVQLATRGTSVSTALSALSSGARETLLLALIESLIANGELFKKADDGSGVEGLALVADVLATVAQLITGTDEEGVVVSANLAALTTPQTVAQSSGAITLDFTATSLFKKTTLTGDITTITCTPPPVHCTGIWQIFGHASNNYSITTPNTSTNWSPDTLDTPDVIPVTAARCRWVTVINDGTNVHWLAGVQTRANA